MPKATWEGRTLAESDVACNIFGHVAFGGGVNFS